MNPATSAKGEVVRRATARPASKGTAKQNTKKRTTARPAARHALAFSLRPGRRSARKAQAAKAQRAPKAPRNRENVRTALWLWCFPVGLSLMWRRACTWPRAVKAGISAAMAAVLLAVFLIPTPTADRTTSGVQMVAGTPEVEVYGPALPNLIVPGYTTESTGSIIVDAVENNVHYVYAADGAKCYHEYECKFAFASSQRLTVYEAYYLGFAPCGRCTPPVYTPGVTDPITAEAMDAGAPVAADASAEAPAA